MPVAETELEIDGIGIGSATDGGAESEIIFTGNEDTASVPAAQPAPPPPKPVKPIVGIIFPPPEVRNIVDKTASFVARNGPDFETRIRQNEINNPKFNFLNSGDPYHAYYQHKVKEIQEGKPVIPQLALQEATIKTPSVQLIDEAKKKKQSELLKQVELPFIPKDPPPEFEFIADPPSISAQDLDVVKLTAQFVARNGRQFLSTLMTREQRNYQFDFLRPQHSLFQYFTKLLEQYTKVLIPPKDIVKRLASEERSKILDDVKYRGNWIRHQEVQRRKVEEEAEKERMAYASIDWHDFVVVETVDYQPFEQGQFPAPTTPQEVGARVLLQDRILQGQIPDKEANDEDVYPHTVDDTQVQDMEEDSDDGSSDEESGDAKASKKQQQGVPEPLREDQVIIKKGYDPKHNKPQEKAPRAGPKPEEWTISPITGERIPVSKLQEHMRISLLDPRWKDQRDRQMNEKVNQESVYAAGYAVDETLKQFAERRSDIFGVGVEETPIGKKVGEEERIPGLPWDPTAGLPPTHALASLDDQNPDEMSGKMESIGSGVISSGATLTGPPQPPSSISQPPQPPPPLPQIPGVVRPLNVMPMPPHQPPNPMMMQGMQRFQPYPGGPGQRPPLLTPGGPMPPHGMPPMPPPPLSKPLLPKPDDEPPPSKKIKSLEDSLIPEAHFLAMHKSPVTFQVLCPSMPEKPEMNLNGQVLIITLALSETVASIKTKIQDSIGLAPGKQKLNVEGLFYKDTNTLAYYNIIDGANITLSLKERGGRKK